MIEGLKPCPFCGGSAKIVDQRLRFYVECCDCELVGPLMKWNGSFDNEGVSPPTPEEEASWRSEAIAAWNTRALSAREADGWRPEVVAFANLMEKQLRANDHKPGWKNDSANSLFQRALDEWHELGLAIETPNSLAVIGKEAADLANFAMMVADVCGALAPPLDDARRAG